MCAKLSQVFLSFCSCIITNRIIAVLHSQNMRLSMHLNASIVSHSARVTLRKETQRTARQFTATLFTISPSEGCMLQTTADPVRRHAAGP